MQPHSNYYNKRLSGSYSRKVEKRKQRLLKNREKIGRPIETDSRRKNWSKYFPDYGRISESLESVYRLNGRFKDKLEVHQEFLTQKNTAYPFGLARTYSLKLVLRGLSDETYSVLRRLPQFDAQARMEAAAGEEIIKKYSDVMSVLAD